MALRYLLLCYKLVLVSSLELQTMVLFIDWREAVFEILKKTERLRNSNTATLLKNRRYGFQFLIEPKPVILLHLNIING